MYLYMILNTLKKNIFRNVAIVIQLILGSVILTLALANYNFFISTFRAAKNVITPNSYRIDLFGKRTYDLQSSKLDFEEQDYSQYMERRKKFTELRNSLIKNDARIAKIGKENSFTANYAHNTSNKSDLLTCNNDSLDIYFDNKELTEMYKYKAKKGMNFEQYFRSNINTNSDVIPILISEKLEEGNPIDKIVTIPDCEGCRFKIIGVLDSRYPTLQQTYNMGSSVLPNDGYFCIAGKLINEEENSIIFISLKNNIKESDIKKDFDLKAASINGEFQFLSLNRMVEDILTFVPGTIKYIFYGIIILLLTTFGVINTVLASILKRKKEFGARIAVGASRKHIQKMVIGEISILFIFSQFISFIISFIVSEFNKDLNLDLKVAGVSFGVLLILLLFSIVPAFIKIYKKKPIDLIHDRR